MLSTILLFDVDGTLVTTAGVGRRALERAFHARYRRTGVLRDLQLDCLTDRAIVRAGLATLGEPVTADAIDAILAAYVPLLEEEITNTPDFRLQRGVLSLLDALAGRRGVGLGLGTGNIREGARAKLTPLGVFDRFRFGGFGCDHEERDEILRVGAERGARLLGVPLAACRVVVIGDTPRDVAAARAIGAEAVGVGSARFSRADLIESGAQRAFGNLDDAGVLGALLGDAPVRGA